MEQFVPHDDGVSDLVDPCRKHFWHHPGLGNASELEDETLDHWSVMTAIILATIYAVCCKSLCQDGKPAGARTYPSSFPRKFHLWTQGVRLGAGVWECANPRSI
jgi:hypothetical protein